MELSSKKHSIGKTIATLRKEKGWTQVELSEKLQVSDKAVSKWEKDDSAPSVEFFPALAELFGVTIDYLMTGKKDEQPFTLDDLDSLKRAVYLVEKDDLSNFEKYRYVNGDILLSETNIDRRTSSRENSTIRKAVVEHQSVKIFGALATDFLEKLRHGRYDYLIGYSTPVAKLVYDYLGDFIKLCALSNHIDIFDYFKSKYYRSENRYCKETNVMNNISTEILDFIFTDPRVPQEVIDYFVQYEDESSKNPWICREGELVRFDPNRTKYQVLHSLYNSKRFDHLDAYMDKMRQEARATFNKFDNPSPVWNMNEGYLYIYYDDTSRGHHYCDYSCSGRMIAAPTGLAIEHKDKAMALKFNEYNAFIKSLADKLLKKGYGGVFKDEKAIDEAIEKVKAEERYQAILSDDTITEYDRRRKLFAIHKLRVSSAIQADDYDLFAQFPFEETKELTISAVAKCCKDIRFYIYAVGLGQPQDKLNDALNKILESTPDRYDIMEVLLSAGAVIKDNPALTAVLKQNVLILNKQKETAMASDVEINNDETKQTLLNALNDGRLEYVIVNLTIQLEKKLKAQFGNGVQLLDMIDMAFDREMISDLERSMLHNLRKARNTIVHQGEERGFYTPELIKEWIEIVYKI